MVVFHTKMELTPYVVSWFFDCFCFLGRSCRLQFFLGGKWRLLVDLGIFYYSRKRVRAVDVGFVVGVAAFGAWSSGFWRNCVVPRWWWRCWERATWLFLPLQARNTSSSMDYTITTFRLCWPHFFSGCGRAPTIRLPSLCLSFSAVLTVRLFSFHFYFVIFWRFFWGRLTKFAPLFLLYRFLTCVWLCLFLMHLNDYVVGTCPIYVCMRMNLYIHMYIIKCGLSWMMTIVEFWEA